MVNFNSVEDRLKLSNACNKLYWGSLLSLVPITIFGPRFSNLGVLLVEFVSLFGKYQFTKNLYKCDEYKRLNEVYDEILNNLVELANEFGLKNPKTTSAGKIDIIYLPPYPWVAKEDVGSFIRTKIKWYLNKI